MSESLKEALPKLRGEIRTALKTAGITTVWALQQWTPEQLLLIPRMGHSRVMEIQDRLAEKGLHLRYPE